MKKGTFYSRIPKGIVSESDVEQALNKYAYQGRTDWRFEKHRIKFDDEDHPVDWSYAAQIVTELMHPSPPLMTLPGAERFYKFLCDRVQGGKISVSQSIVLDTSYDRDYAKLYKIFANGKKIGEYKTFGPGPRERNFTREYSGILPNKESAKEEQCGFTWSNKHHQPGSFADRLPGRIITTKWKRQDGWEGIPFP